MSTWREEYFAALSKRDLREKANTGIFDAYTRLADRTADIEKSQSLSRRSSERKSSTKTTSVPSDQNPSELLHQARQDLAKAQKSRTELSDQLSKTQTQLEKLRKNASADAKKITTLTSEKSRLQVKLKDKDEEVSGKTKLLDDMQGEIVTLNLQFNMAEERVKKLEVDNKDLVERWMARKGQEADAMNRASKFS